nr:EOG090X0267 [Triops cancriformis]
MLSPDPEENPYWWNANHVYIPYCSSDSWSGTAAQGSGTRFAFMGAIILQEVLRDLQLQGMSNASKIFLTGSSAGGIGILLNLDKAVELLRSWGSKADIRGVSDSGWFLDHAPFAPVDCVDPQRCSPSTAVQLGYKLWQAQLPEACVKDHASQPWKCYFGHHIHRTMKTPLFVFQWLFDEAQITAGNVGPPITKQQWDYIHKVGDQLRQSLENVSAVFAPSCISHTVLTNRDWQNFRVGSVGLPQALRCWELRSPSHTSDEQGYFGQGPHIRHNHKLKNKETNHVTTVLLSDEPGSTAISRPARKLVKSGSTNQQRNNASSADRVAVSLSEKEHNSSSVGRGDRKKQKDNSRRKNRPRTKGGNKKVADAGEEAVRKRAASDKVKVPKAKRGHGKGNKKNKTANWEEVKRLAADFRLAQLSSTTQKLSERNCVEIMSKLLQLKLLDVYFTTDGKEYITPQQLSREIRDELFLHGGRISLTELVPILNPLLPSVFGPADVLELLQEALVLRKKDTKSHSAAIILAETVLVSDAYVQQLKKSFETLIREKAKKLVDSGAYLQAQADNRSAGKGHTDANEGKKDKKEERRKKAVEGKSGGGTQGRETKTKSTKKKYLKGKGDDWDSDGEDSAPVISKPTELEFMSTGELVRALRQDVSLKDAPEEMIQDLAEMLQRPLTLALREEARLAFQALLSASATDKRKSHGDLQEKIQNLITGLMQADKALKQFPTADLQQQLAKHALKTLGGELVMELLAYAAQEGTNIDVSKEYTLENSLSWIYGDLNDPKTLRFTGVLSDHMESLARALNYSFELVVPKDQKTGTQTSNGSWTGLFGLMVNNETDLMGYATNLLVDRYRIVDWVYAAYDNTFAFVIPVPDVDENWLASAQPYHYKVKNT